MKILKSQGFILLLLLTVSMAYSQDDTRPDAKLTSLIEIDENYGLAKQKIDGLLAANEKDPEAYYFQGLLNLATEDNEAARDAFRAGIKARSKYVYNHIGLARAYNKLGMTTDRDNSIAQTLKLGRKDEHYVPMELSVAYIEAKDFSQAMVLLYRVRESYSDDAEPWIKIAELYSARGVPESAKEHYEEAIKLKPDYVKGYLGLGQIYIQEASELKKEWGEKEPTEEYKTERKAILIKGLKSLNKAVELDANLAPAYQSRGDLYLTVGQYDKATADYEKYVSLLPGDKKAQYRYAKFLYLSGNYEKALSELKKSDVKSFVKSRLLGYCNIELGNFAEGKNMMDQYFKEAPEGETLSLDHEAMAKYYKSSGETDKAVASYVKMFEMDSDLDPKKYLLPMAIRAKKAKNYADEAFYRKANIGVRGDKKRLPDYFAYGLSLYNYGKTDSTKYVEALEAFAVVKELKEDWESGYYWTAVTLEKINHGPSGSMESYQKVYDLLNGESLDEMKKSSKKHLLRASILLAVHHFNPEQLEAPTAEQVDCAGAKPFIDKVLAIDPENGSVAPLVNHCNPEGGE